MSGDFGPYLVRINGSGLVGINAYISIGSNLGDRMANLQVAVNRLKEISILPIKTSSVWETEPLDCPAGSPMFLNAVVRITVSQEIGPLQLLNQLLCIERDLGRHGKRIHNMPRIIDLDLICMGWYVCYLPEIILPHPRAHQRPFVLAPLVEIEPQLILPGFSITVEQLFKELSSTTFIKRLEIGLV